MGKGVVQYRTEDYRVFLSGPYFSVDLEHEIRWHKDHLKKLHHHKKNPHFYHRQFTDGPIREEHLRDYEEQVLNSIPFHEKILAEQETRLKAIIPLIGKGRYKKLVQITRKHGAVPPYFIYDKHKKKGFFLIEHPAPHLALWVKDAKRHILIIETDPR